MLSFGLFFCGIQFCCISPKMLRWVSMTFLGAKWRCCIVILINLITFVICQLAMCWGSVCGKGWCRHRRLTIFYSYLLSSCQLANCAQMCIENYEKRSQVQIVSIPKFRSNSNSICIIQHTHILAHIYTYICMKRLASVLTTSTLTMPDAVRRTPQIGVSESYE